MSSESLDVRPVSTTPAADAEVHPAHPPVVPIPQNPSIPTRRLSRLVQKFPQAQFFRYLCTGIWNTIFGYCTYAGLLFLFSKLLPQRYLYLAVVIASLISTPLNITVAYFCYKFFVFRTKGNYLMEWLRCFAVYGVGMLPGLLILSALTRFLQTVLHNHRGPILAMLSNAQASVASHASLVSLIGHLSNSKAAAGYIAGAIVMSFTTISGFVGHKKLTFKAARPAPNA